LGAGALFPIALAIIGDIFAPSERGRYQGFFGAVFGVSTLVGPALGGLITDNFSWHWIFYVNVPIGAVVLYVVWRALPTHHEVDADRHIDYLGATLLAAALVPMLIGFTNKQFGEWTDPEVGGLIALGLVLAAVFVFVESRAREPIVPLGLFRMPAFTASVIAFFLAIMGFFAAVVFLPRWFQFVQGSSATESGYQILPLLLGLIVSAISTGQLISAMRRYKTLIIVALVIEAVGLFLLTNIRPDTPSWMLWLWMAVTGIGVGPSFAAFTLVVQNAVPPRSLGSATSSLTLFQQIGGTIGLAITGTVLSSKLLEEMPRQMTAGGVPEQLANQFGSGGNVDFNQLTSVGGNLGAQILAGTPDQFKPAVEPFIQAIVNGIYAAFSIATGATFLVGIVTALVAALVVLVVMPAGRIGHREG
jgi:EmrB/QacA subfamily drug resistance transporter